MDAFSLEGRTAIVTGASRGIGAAVASALDAAGARVALVARSEDDLAKVAAALGHEPLVIGADLAEPDAPDAVAEAALDGLGRVDILVNNAGDGCADGLDRPGRRHHRRDAPAQRAQPAAAHHGAAAADGGAPAGVDRQRVVGLGPGRHPAPLGLRRLEGGGRRHDPLAGHGVRPARHPGQLGGARCHRHVDVGAQPGRTWRDRAGRGPDRPAAVGPARRCRRRRRVPRLRRRPLRHRADHRGRRRDGVHAGLVRGAV